MNKAQKEVLQAQLDREKELIKDLKQVFGQAQDDVVNKIIDLSRRQDMENLQTIIYQMQYQEVLKQQIDTVLDQLQTNEYTRIEHTGQVAIRMVTLVECIISLNRPVFRV